MLSSRPITSWQTSVTFATVARDAAKQSESDVMEDKNRHKEDEDEDKDQEKKDEQSASTMKTLKVCLCRKAIQD